MKLCSRAAGNNFALLRRWLGRRLRTFLQALQSTLIRLPIPGSLAQYRRRLLHDMGYSLLVNHKQILTNSSPHRNLQFEHLAELRHRFRRRHLPIVSVDSN